MIAKSLTTRAAGIVAERGLPAIWLTPLLDDPGVGRDAAARTAQALLIGGTADRSWDGALARELSDDVVEIEAPTTALLVSATCRPIADAVAAFV